MVSLLSRIKPRLRAWFFGVRVLVRKATRSLQRVGVVPVDQHFHFVCVEFKGVAFHPVGDARHSPAEVGCGAGGVF